VNNFKLKTISTGELVFIKHKVSYYDNKGDHSLCFHI